MFTRDLIDSKKNCKGERSKAEWLWTRTGTTCDLVPQAPERIFLPIFLYTLLASIPKNYLYSLVSHIFLSIQLLTADELEKPNKFQNMHTRTSTKKKIRKRVRLLNDAWYIPAHSQLAIASALQAKTFAFWTLKCTARHLSHVIR